MSCPLCNSSQTEQFAKDKQREYFKCSQCDLTYVPKEQLISLEAERARYDTHNNNLDDPRYCTYLQSKITDIKELGVELSTGPILDFGAGKEAVMTYLLCKEGFDATAFDPIYGLDDLSKAPFYTIIMNEVIEHLYEPLSVLETVVPLLHDKGYLYINTELTDPVPNFEKWWYRSDPTHVIFFSEETFAHIAKKFKLTLIDCNHKNRVLLQKL